MKSPDRARTGPRAMLFAIALIAGAPVAPAQSPPERATAMLRPAEGLEATLWAAEPMVENPTNMDIDSRGRVWVTEGLNYRLHRGANKTHPRIADADRIKILEDTDGDGKADKVTVFADKIFPVPMGIAVEEVYDKAGKYKGARVYVGNSPDLLVFEDTDGDDKADKRSALLTGFGGVDSDHGVHGMTLGLDGKLYFTHGDGCCSVQEDRKSEKPQNFDVVDRSGRHVKSSNLANTLRVNRDGTEFEVIADRQRNNYETALDAWGHPFTSDNDDDGNRGSRVIWAMDGGTYGYHTPGSPRHWGEEVPGNSPKLVGTGNGSPTGIAVYEGSLLPGDYQGGLFEADAGSRQINFFPIERHGAHFRTTYKVLLGSDDNWFRPVDVAALPDGSVLVADWYDSGVGGHSFRDQTTGRIYRVAPKGAAYKKVPADFSTVPGLIAALRSPVVATQDAARRSLIARGAEATPALKALSDKGTPVEKARALWVRHAIEGDAVAVAALKEADPRIREQAVKILGRDLSRNGDVEFTNPEARRAPRAESHLNDLLPLANDPDPGVRRELITSLRWLSTAQVGDALKALAAGWDGQDRWYLEALGLALQDRETPYLESLFDGTLFGALNLDRDGAAEGQAVPPYFPADRNEAYIASGTADAPSSPVAKTLGLAWRIHRPEALPLLARILPELAATDLQQAADDVLTQFKDKEAALIVADLALKTVEPARRQSLMKTLGRKIGGDWLPARAEAPVIRLIEDSLNDPAWRIAGIALASSAADGRYGPALMAFARDEQVPEDVRVASVEAIGRLRLPKSDEFFDSLIAAAKGGKGASGALAEAAVRTLPDAKKDANARLLALATDPAYSLSVRREALRTYGRPRGGGGNRILELARSGKLPEELKSEAVSIVYADPDRNVRRDAADVLPLPKTTGGRPLPSPGELLRRDGDAAKGRAVFFREAANSCAGCHRVQGQGRWVGPDLSTIGTKYGKDELLRSILNPSAAIGYNYRSTILAMNDGRVLTGLVVEEAPDRIVLKMADGKRTSARPADVEDRKQSEVSLMPEGLAETMTDGDLVDLLAYLSTLRQPVSIVGQFQAAGPMADAGPVSPRMAAPARLSWRRIDADAEGLVDLSATAGTAPSKAAFLHAPVLAHEAMAAKLVLDTKADVRVWLGGKEIPVPAADADRPRAVDLSLAKGDNDLVVRVAGGTAPGLVATFVAAKPLEFRSGESAPKTP
ncbi:PVC-type heme-binding CxxCH protein [Tundrisphaera sp. TA3]|uniref:PVC-type heme-binding CxxCH protein n=1 Tax=Tundrisphaera sp. TA3 TaxID=3435775 RepID=UPI003EC01D67